MGKDNPRHSRALWHLEAYNKSPHGRPKDRASGSHGDVRAVHDTSASSSGRRNKSHGSLSRLSSPAQPPEWAKQLLEQQQANAAELKRLQNELASSSSKVAKKQLAPDPEFRFAGNKKQYELNQDIMEKIDEALESVDADERSAKLNEGKDLLLERNKHILLAEKYGWDTMACYTAEPLATDSDDEKRIHKAVKESKQLGMKRKGQPPPNRRRKGVFPGNLPNGEYLLTGQPPVLLWRENSLLPARCAPHVFAVFDRDILPGIANQQLPLAGSMGMDKQAPNSLPSDEHS